MVDKILEFASFLANNIIWSPYTLIFIGIVSASLTIGARFFQFRRFGLIMKSTFGTLFKKSEKKSGITPFQATATALASTVGTGNIAGVATAISVGGPGAVFWMWLLALLGMVTKVAEVSIAIHYRERDEDGNFRGGPMYYMKKGLGWTPLAKVFCVCLIINALLTAALLQPHTAGRAFLSSYGINPYLIAIGMAVVTGIVIIGGIKRIATFCEYLTPIMAIVYVATGLIVFIVNFEKIPEVFGMIFKYAFAPAPAIGGFAGAVVATAIQKGMSRGIMSNEAGQGSAPMAHATAETPHPVQQGMWGAFEVFVDTIIVCTVTAFVVLSTDVLGSGLSGVDLVLAGFDTVFPGTVASMLLSFAILTFCLSSQIGFYIYYETCVHDLLGRKAVKFFKFLFLVPGIVCAGIANVDALWVVADIATGLTAIPNLIAVIALSGVFFKLLKDYESGENKYVTAITDKTHRYIRESKAYRESMEHQQNN